MRGKITRHLRVMLASPGDMTKEREIVGSVVHEVNRIFSSSTGFSIELRQWEDLAPAIAPDGVQNLIDRELDIDHCELVLALFGLQCGKGTEHEVRRAIERFTNTGKPELMLFFRTGGPLPSSSKQLEQYQGVLNLRDEIQRIDMALYCGFEDAIDLEKKVLNALSKFLLDSTSRSAKSPIEFSVSAAPRVVRAESMSEEIGDLNLAILWPHILHGTVVEVNLSIYLNVNITNCLSAAQGTAVPLGIRMHLQEGGHEIHVTPACRLGGINELVFERLPLRASSDWTRVQITGIRANASMLGVTSTFLKTEIAAYVKVEACDVDEIMIRSLSPGQKVAEVKPSYSFRLASKQLGIYEPGQVSQGLRMGPNLETFRRLTWDDVSLCLQFSEHWNGVFRTADDEEQATIGTQFRVRFLSVPKGVRILVPIHTFGMSPFNEAANLILIDEGEMLPNSPQAGMLLGVPCVEITAALPETGTTYETSVTYEWRLSGERVVPISATIPVVIAVEPSACTGTGLVTGDIGPLSLVHGPSSTAPVPRFVEFRSLASQKFLVISAEGVSEGSS